MRFVFLDPIKCYISAPTVVIETLITTPVLCFVEIITFIQTVTIVVVQTFLLLLRFPIVWLLSLSILLQLLSLFYNNTPLLTSIPMASSMLSCAANAFVAPLPVHSIPINQIESMELTYPSTNSSMDSRVTLLSVRQTVNVAIGLLTGMTSAKEYVKMLDPLQYNVEIGMSLGRYPDFPPTPGPFLLCPSLFRDSYYTYATDTGLRRLISDYTGVETGMSL